MSDLKRSWAMWALIVALLGGYAYYNITPRRVVEVVHGTAIGAHQPPTDDNSAPLIVAVQLDTGAMVNVPVPRGTLYRAGLQVEVAVVRRDWPPYAISYRFIRYIE